jgi:diguanylate cyclase (GGDEF)-like protein
MIAMGAFTPFRGLYAWYARQTRVLRDAIVIGLVGLPVCLLALWFDAFDKFLELTNQPQSDAIDWLVVLIVFLGIAAKLFSVRRVIDLRREVTKRRKAETEAYQLARHDVLTGLPNRRWFIEDFEKWAHRLPEGEACALFVVDLDNFKPINDVYGHRLGDEVLKVVARGLSRIAEGGSVARLGGDEFGIIQRYRLGSDAPERLARRIVHEIHRPIALAALSLQVGVSVGVSTGVPQEAASNVAMAARDGTRVETALRQADMAMYWAKAEGRGRYRFFDRGMDEKLQQRVELEAEIRSAIAAGQIVPYYQPIVDLDTGTTLGFEVLARWEHPKRGLLSPDIFIPIAEDTGTIGEMTDRLLERAMRDAKNWPDRIALSINFSPRQISFPDLAPRILGLLNKASFPPHRLVIEITESAVVQRLEDAKSVLRALRNVGVRIALDDFGTGYSGLYHLRELELDTIKIDRSFVGQMLDKPDEARMVKAMLSLSRALGLKTTAEGIESEAALELLMKLGCDAGQGYLFGRPEPAAVVTEALRKETDATRKAGKESARWRRIA